MTTLSPQENAMARHASYMLLARLLREPISAEIESYLTAIPELTPSYLCPDDAKIAHQQLFGFDLFPHESIFRDSSGLIGGATADQVIMQYQQGGFRWHGEPDHIANELAFLAFLTGAETDAFEDDKPIIAARMRQLQGDFLQAHLLQWLPPFVVAVQRNGDPFYQAVATLLWQLVSDHAEQSITPFVAAPQPKAPDLTDSETALKTIGRFLTSPHESGWWLSGTEMGEISRALNLPRGFGGRIQTMMNLFRSASQFDGAVALLAALQARAETWQAAYRALDNRTITAAWQQRLTTTIELLEQMQLQVQS